MSDFGQKVVIYYIDVSKGTLLKQWDYISADILDVNAEGIPSGLYYITVIVGQKKVTKKVIIK